MLRYQGVSAFLRTLLGGILLLGANTAYSQSVQLKGNSWYGQTLTATASGVPSTVTFVIFGWRVCPTRTFDAPNCPVIISSAPFTSDGGATDGITINATTNDNSIAVGSFILARVNIGGTIYTSNAIGPFTANPPLALDPLPTHASRSGSGSDADPYTYTFESGRGITDIVFPTATTGTGTAPAMGAKSYTLNFNPALPAGLGVVRPDNNADELNMDRTSAGRTGGNLKITGSPNLVTTTTTINGIWCVQDSTTPNRCTATNIVKQDTTFTAETRIVFRLVITPPPPPATPTAPTFVAASVDSSGLPLIWTKPTTGTTVIGFKVYAGTNSTFTANAGSLVATLGLGAGAANCADSDTTCAYSVAHADLAAGMDNYFRVVATGSGGDSNPSDVSMKWTSPPTLIAPSSGLTASFVAGISNGEWEAPPASGGLGNQAYTFANLPSWLTANNATRTLRISDTVPPVGTSVANITYRIQDLGGRDSEVTAEITLQIDPPGALLFPADVRVGDQTYDPGSTVEAFSLGNAAGGSGGSRSYSLRKIGGSAANLAALGLEAVGGGNALTASGNPPSYASPTPISIRSIAGRSTLAGSITLRYGVSETSGAERAEYQFSISVGAPPAPPATAPAAADSGGSSSGGIVALAIIGAGAYYWWKKRTIANGNAAKVALLPDVSFDLDRNDKRAFYTKMNWANSGNSNWQLRSNLQMHTKYSGKLLDWHADSHIGYRLNGKFGEFNPYVQAKFVANAPENAKMLETYTLGVNYAIPNRFSVQFLQPDDEIWRYSLKMQVHLPKAMSLQLEQPNSDLKNYGFGVSWRGKSQIRYGLSGETVRNSYRFTGEFAF